MEFIKLDIYMVKPLYNRHHQDHKIMSVIVSIIVSTKKRFFLNCLILFRMLWYSIIEPKVFQKVSVERKKSLKSINWWISCLYDNLKASRWWVFVTHERANQQSGQECCFFGSYKFSLKRRSGWPFTTDIHIHICIHISIPVPLRFGHLCIWRTCQL